MDGWLLIDIGVLLIGVSLLAGIPSLRRHSGFGWPTPMNPRDTPTMSGKEAPRVGLLNALLAVRRETPRGDPRTGGS
jgi:hypothetical protein